MRRIIFILIGFVVILLVAALGFWLFNNFSNTDTPQNSLSNLPTFPTINLGTGSLKGVGDKNNAAIGAINILSNLTTTPLFGFWLNKKENLIYGVVKNGGVIKLAEGKEELVLDDIYTGVSEIKPSINGINALIKNQKEGEDPEFLVATKSSFKIPKSMGAADWSIKDDNILIFLDSEGLKTIEFAKIPKTTKIIDLTYLEGDLTTTPDNKILLRDKYYPGLNTGWLIDLKNKSIVLVTLNNEELLNRCVTTENGEICAKNNTLLNKVDYLMREVTANDVFYRNNALLFTPQEKTDAINLIYTGSNFYYLNRINGLAYQYNLAS